MSKKLEPIPVPVPDWPVPREALDKVLQTVDRSIRNGHTAVYHDIAVGLALREIDERLKTIERLRFIR